VKTVFRKSFERDLKRIKDRSVLEQTKQAIEEVEAAASLQEISGVKKLSGAGSFYRIRIGEYRIGIAVEVSEVEFVRCLHRREIYRYFP
jgi:mRNA interferase RelE/StbE